MSLTKKIILLLIIVACGLAGISYLSQKKKAALIGIAAEATPPSITVVAARTQPIAGEIAVTGTLVAREEVLVGAEAEGLRITDIHADEGDTVKAGQILADLARDTIDAQIAQNAASLTQAESQVTSAQATLDEATAALGRTQTLKAEGFQTQAALDQREAATKTAAAQLGAAKSAMDVVRAQGRELQAGLKRRYLRSPVDGIIARRSASLGQVVSASSEPLFRIIENGDLELLAEVPEKSVASMQVGQPATVITDGGIAVAGQLRIVSPEINNVTRLGRIRISLPHDAGLKTGAFARAAIRVAEKDALVVPSRAVTHDETGASLMVVSADKVHIRKVRTGLTDAGNIEIVEGLQQGEMVVEKAGTFLRDGDTVHPVTAAEGAQTAPATETEGD